MKGVYARSQPGYEGADPTIIETPRDLVEAKGKRTLEKRQRRVDVLAQLHGQWQRDASGKSGITDEQYRAGRLFQYDAERAELRAKGSLFIAIGTGVFALSDDKLSAMSAASAARTRIVRAFGYLGQDAQRFAVLVLLERASTSAAARLMGWMPHAGVPVLRLVLSVLARVYVDRDMDCT